jgi:hypothetical protein
MAEIEGGGSPGRQALTKRIGPTWSRADEAAYYA